LNFFNGFEYDPTPEEEAMVLCVVLVIERGRGLRGSKCAAEPNRRGSAGSKESTNRSGSGDEYELSRETMAPLNQ
jgi:hypothetical protein